MGTTPERRRIVDEAAAADYLHTRATHLRDLRYGGKIPHLKLGRLIRYDLDALDAWLDRALVGDRK
jgi:excisionase family DNA binding protein